MVQNVQNNIPVPTTTPTVMAIISSSLSSSSCRTEVESMACHYYHILYGYKLADIGVAFQPACDDDCKLAEEESKYTVVNTLPRSLIA